MPLDPQTYRRVILRFVIPFFALLAAIGVGILVATQAQVQAEQESFDWRSTTGTVRASEVIERPTPTRRLVTFEPRVTYVYRAGESEYESSRIGFGDHFVTSRAEADAIVARYPVGATIEVFYDPARPHAAILEPAELGGVRLSAAVGILLVGLPALVIGALLIGLFRQRHRSQPDGDA